MAYKPKYTEEEKQFQDTIIKALSGCQQTVINDIMYSFYNLDFKLLGNLEIRFVGDRGRVFALNINNFISVDIAQPVMGLVRATIIAKI